MPVRHRNVRHDIYYSWNWDYQDWPWVQIQLPRACAKPKDPFDQAKNESGQWWQLSWDEVLHTMVAEPLRRGNIICRERTDWISYAYVNSRTTISKTSWARSQGSRRFRLEMQWSAHWTLALEQRRVKRWEWIASIYTSWISVKLRLVKLFTPNPPHAQVCAVTSHRLPSCKLTAP